MKSLLVLLLAVPAIGLSGEMASEKSYPFRLVIPAKAGGITFQHFLHGQRVNFDCSVCHPAIWPKDVSAPLNYKDHETDSARATGCGACHSTQGKVGKAFTTQNRCATLCHSRYAGNGGPQVAKAAPVKTAPKAAAPRNAETTITVAMTGK